MADGVEDRVKLCDGPMFQCSICCHDVDNRTSVFEIESCHCRFCRECVRQYCVSQVNTISVPIRCPDSECNSLLSSNEINSLLTDEQFQLYNKLLLDHEVTNDPRRLFCPQVDCGHILRIPAERRLHKASPLTCRKCQSTFCLKCRATWHPNEHCVDLLTPFELEPDSNIKRCPRCRFPLEWVAGCAQIMCVNCKHIFCWYCLQSLDNDFFLLHFERGACRNRLGHSRASLFLHRLTIVGIFAGLILLLLIATPFLILSAPCLLCCRYKQIKNRLKNLTKWGQHFQQQQYTPTAHPSPSSSLNQLNSSPSLIDLDQQQQQSFAQTNAEVPLLSSVNDTSASINSYPHNEISSV